MTRLLPYRSSLFLLLALLAAAPGAVADPPFPALEIKLDKSFEPGPGGYWLVRRHTGEVRVSLLLGSKWGLRHIFYDQYVLSD